MTERKLGPAAARRRTVSCRAASEAEVRGGYSSKEKGTAGRARQSSSEV
ncbi:hypothetical protein [Microbacterium sp. NIBRBAC000506063]|nr:hypothetical protein [Microbacterium sp. NIBRBAC000506063]